jgi:hypothetical protein
VIGICFGGVTVEISQTASVTALEPVQDPDAVSKDEAVTLTAISARRLSDKLAQCQLRVGKKHVEALPSGGEKETQRRVRRNPNHRPAIVF